MQQVQGRVSPPPPLTCNKIELAECLSSMCCCHVTDRPAFRAGCLHRLTFESNAVAMPQAAGLRATPAACFPPHGLHLPINCNAMHLLLLWLLLLLLPERCDCHICVCWLSCFMGSSLAAAAAVACAARCDCPWLHICICLLIAACLPVCLLACLLCVQFIGSMFGVPAWGPRLERMQDAFVSE